mmetsp:Transcript_3978/g.13262  ORF Transcript_3978/g.13262 Transcript_3978/m.13262 type:complete len:360 (+) Transcript_3978:1730-2809(+)
MIQSIFRIAPFRVAAARHPVPRRVRAVHIAGSAVGGGGDTSTSKTQNTSSGSHEKEKTPTHELAVTSTNDIVDAVIRRALRCTDLTNDHEFGDDLEHHGTRHAQDATLLDTLATRWHDLTSSEASDVLHAVGRSPRFGVSALDAQRGALLDTFARQDGPFHTMIEQRPNRYARRPTKPTDKERSDFKNDLRVPAWRGAPRRNETWHGLPFMYSVSDIARVVFALASFPNSTDQHALVDRSVLAESAAHVTATFSRDAWTRLHASEGDLATLVFSFTRNSAPTKYSPPRWRTRKRTTSAGSAWGRARRVLLSRLLQFRPLSPTRALERKRRSQTPPRSASVSHERIKTTRLNRRQCLNRT